jgi:hypothetical protein
VLLDVMILMTFPAFNSTSLSTRAWRVSCKTAWLGSWNSMRFMCESLAGVYDGVGVAGARSALQQQRDDVGIAQYIVELRGVAGHVMQAK